MRTWQTRLLVELTMKSGAKLHPALPPQKALASSPGEKERRQKCRIGRLTDLNLPDDVGALAHLPKAGVVSSNVIARSKAAYTIYAVPDSCLRERDTHFGQQAPSNLRERRLLDASAEPGPRPHHSPRATLLSGRPSLSSSPADCPGGGTPMIATLRRLLLVSAGAVALSACGPAEGSGNFAKSLSEAAVAYERADYVEAIRLYRLAADKGLGTAQYKLGVMYNNGLGVAQDYTEALRWYRLAADQGHAWAQYNLGTMHRDGEGVPQNYAEALRWFRLAADQGQAEAQTNLGVMYNRGNGVPKNYVEAVRWYRLAADKGLAAAQLNLGTMYENGRGVAQDYAEALRWYRLAADQGEANAQSILGSMYRAGEGVPQNYAEALRWYRLAADQGDWFGQYFLGSMYEKGEGVPQNYVEAYKWWSLAAAQGDIADAAKNRDLVLAKMTPAQIAEGQKLSAAWKPKSGMSP